MASDDAVILLDSLRFGYHRSAVVVDGVSAALRPGRLTVMVGPNAAGKSTLMRLMLGLLRPWSGAVSVGGLPLHRLGARDRARWLSYVPQQPGVRFAFTVRQVVAMGAFSAGKSTNQATDRALAESGIAELAEQVYAELSGGQQQRVVMARARLQAASGGRAMLLDEPGSHLDLRHRHATMQQLRSLARSGLAVLVVLHDLDLAVRYADDAWLIDQGRLVAAGRWDEVLTPRLLEPVYGLRLRPIDSGGDRPMLAVLPAQADTMP